jgi:hypothetical protein
MVTSYNTGSPSAQIKLTAVHSGHGGVIRENLRWTLTPINTGPNLVSHQSHQAQINFTVIPGTYQIFALYQENEIDCGQEQLLGNTAIDLVFILNPSDLFHPERQYSAKTDPFFEYDRRKADRESELKHGGMATPLKDPSYKPEMGSQLSRHPLLDHAQFDGIPPQITPDPTENEEASNKAELQLQQQLQHQQAAQATPSVTPSPFG